MPRAPKRTFVCQPGRALPYVLAAVVLCALLAATVVMVALAADELTAGDVLAACEQHGAVASLEVSHPLNQSRFPRDIAAPTFRWKGGGDAWVVSVGQGPGACVSELLSRPRWTPSPRQWQALKRARAGKG